ncbi:hypothetical protein F3Y22_tig00110831pilonHSYRG00739 [Hibiscus syriacus]|uniref:Uncharacterized protein n=1 Tax=Hibiscus syriacus TaxID=106335 RepID=A0A6A2ZLA3_HIBSY|nr:hypothetical protein F3Y22_tig00110831pilonHSYRG00739 [Hibiscus syriacus]
MVTSSSLEGLSAGKSDRQTMAILAAISISSSSTSSPKYFYPKLHATPLPAANAGATVLDSLRWPLPGKRDRWDMYRSIEPQYHPEAIDIALIGIPVGIEIIHLVLEQAIWFNSTSASQIRNRINNH